MIKSNELISDFFLFEHIYFHGHSRTTFFSHDRKCSDHHVTWMARHTSSSVEYIIASCEYISLQIILMCSLKHRWLAQQLLQGTLRSCNVELNGKSSNDRLKHSWATEC